MMVFTSIYSVVDGLFISNFAGKTAFAAVNLILPVVFAFASVGFMIGTGGSALVAKTLGEGDTERANKYFSTFIAVTLVAGVVLTAVGEATLAPVARALQASNGEFNREVYDGCILYGAILIASMPAFMLQNAFQSFFTTAGKPKLGLYIIVSAGLTNAALDALFIAVFKWGLVGAAAATCAGEIIGGVLPVIYFARKNSSTLRLRFVKWQIKPILKACANGSSEMMSQLSMSVVNMIYNFQLMRFFGENGVSAYGFAMYVSFIFAAIFIGYSIGVSPVIGYNFGAQNKAELRNVLKRSLVIVGIVSVLMLALSLGLNSPLSYIFVGYDEALFELTKYGFFIYSFAFLICGFNIFGSALFTALNNGLISALISFSRTLLFQIICVLVLPVIFGADGIWYAIIIAEALSLAVTVTFILTNYKRYFKEIA